MRKKDEGYMGMVRVGPKGQIVIPKEVRDMFDIAPGDSLMLVATPARGIGIQRPGVLAKMAEAIFAGQGAQACPGEQEQDLQAFAAHVEQALHKEDGDGRD